MKKIFLFIVLWSSIGFSFLLAEIINQEVPFTLESIQQEVEAACRRRFQSSVRVGTSVSAKELNTIAKRLPKVYQSIQQFTGVSFKQKETPFVSLVCSGGGYRAMIATAGFLAGLEEIGLLDSTMYLAGLSGSTWTMASWLSQDMSLAQFRTFLRERVATHIKDYPIDFAGLVKTFARKFYYGQPITLADMWGYLVGRVIFSGLENGAFDAKLSQLEARVQDGNTVFPLFTSVLSDASPYEWMEFSPYEIGSEFLQGWVDADCFGKKFKYGKTSDNAPEQSFSYLCGIFGSAYAASVWDVLIRLKEMIENWWHREKRDARSFFSFNLFDFLDTRLSPARVNGFTYQLGGTNFSGYQHYELVDAGIDFNLPFPPVLRRISDIIIVCDVSSDAVDANTPRDLGHAVRYAKRKGLKFPYIDLKKVKENTINVFYDENDPACPIVVYCPNKVAFSTLKMQYSGEEFDLLFDYMKNAIVSSKDELVAVVKRGISNVQQRFH